MTWLDRAHLAVTDLGADRINVVRWSEAGPEIIGSLKTPAGCGPRHLTLTEDGHKQVLTVGGALSGTVSTWSRPTGHDMWAREWRFVQETASSRWSRTGSQERRSACAPASPSAIVTTPDGRHFVANRSVGSIGILGGRFGRLNLIDEFDTTGANPRDITVTTQNGTRVWVALPEEGQIAIHLRDEDTGAGRSRQLSTSPAPCGSSWARLPDDHGPSSTRDTISYGHLSTPGDQPCASTPPMTTPAGRICSKVGLCVG